jgi:hypothetical protein
LDRCDVPGFFGPAITGKPVNSEIARIEATTVAPPVAGDGVLGARLSNFHIQHHAGANPLNPRVATKCSDGQDRCLIERFSQDLGGVADAAMVNERDGTGAEGHADTQQNGQT